MTAVVVVTRNPALAIGLQRHGYDVSDVRPDRYGDWTVAAARAAAVVLELSDPLAAEAAVQRLRSEGLGVPVLLVSNNTPGWETTASHAGPGTRVLPLPISLPALLAAVESLVASGPVEVVPEPVAAEPVTVEPAGAPATEADLLNAVAASIGMSISESGTLVAGGPDEAEPAAESAGVEAAAPGAGEAEQATPEVPEPAAEPGMPEPAAGPEVAEAEPAAEPAVAEAATPAAEPEEAGRAAATPAADAGTGPAPEAPPAVAPGPPPGTFAELVTALLDRSADLTSLTDCGDLAADELADRTGAEAAACLVADGDEWRVAGGRGLSPEQAAFRAPVTEDPAPLAGFPHTVAAPVPGVRGVLVAARTEPFPDDATNVAAEVADEAAALLRDAVAARTLARALRPYAG